MAYFFKVDHHYGPYFKHCISQNEIYLIKSLIRALFIRNKYKLKFFISNLIIKSQCLTKSTPCKSQITK